MTVSREQLLKTIGAVKEPLSKVVNNVRTQRVVRLVRRVRNEDETPIDDMMEEEVVEEAPAEEETVAEVGDTVVIQPTGEEITGEIVEVIPDEEAAAEEEIVDEEPVQNRRYRRIKNARILHNADGTRDVLVPIDEKRVTNVRRYKTRTVTRNSGISVDGTYAKTISTPDAASWATTVNKARAYDRMLLNTSIEQSIDEALKKALSKNGISNCKSGSCKNSRTISKVLRFNNYRRITNDDGTVSIEVNLGDGAEVANPIVPEVIEVPVVEPATVPYDGDNVEVVVDGREVPLDNARNHGVVRGRQATVRNESVIFIDNAALEVPTTFPNHE